MIRLNSVKKFVVIEASKLGHYEIARLLFSQDGVDINTPLPINM